MTLEQITVIDKELVAASYEAAIAKEFGALARFLDMTIEEIGLAETQVESRTFW